MEDFSKIVQIAVYGDELIVLTESGTLLLGE